MPRWTAAMLTACLTLELSGLAAHAQAGDSFRDVPVVAPAPRRYTWAYATLAGGTALVGLSFEFARRADDAYAAYLVSTEPDGIQRLYDRTVRNDHLSQASLLTGEALVAAGLYLRFIRRPAPGRVSLSLRPSRCAVSYRF